MRFFKKNKLLRFLYKKYVNKLIRPIIKIINRYREGVSYLYNYIFPSIPSGPVRLVIFGQGRTGSTLLENLICSTGYFRPNGELFNTDRGEILYPIQFIHGLLKRSAKKNFIFHVKIYQLTHDRKRPIDPAVFLETLYAEGWKIIYLKRRNKVKHVLSNIIAEHRAAPHKYDNNKEKFNIHVNCSDFVEGVKGRFSYDKSEKQALRNVKYHEVVYEEDLEKSTTHQQTVDKIMDYVSLEHRKVTTIYRKINTQSLNELISNYDEFVVCLQKHQWQSFLEN